MRAVLRRLADRRLTNHALLGYGVLLLFLAGWGVKVPPEVVGSISELAPFWLLYGAVGVHLVACLAASWPAMRGRLALAPAPADPGVPVPSLDPDGLPDAARRAGLRLRWLEPGRVAVLHRNRFSPLGTVLSHAALLLLPLAFLVARESRFEGVAWIVEGHRFDGTRDEYVRVDPPGATPPELRFSVDTVEAAFWGRRLFFTDLRALLTTQGAGARSAFVTVNEPLREGGARVTLRGFNYTPSFLLRSAAAGVLSSGDLNLRLFPPGVEDSFTLPGLPHRVFVRLRPERDGNRLLDPRLLVAVTAGRRLVWQGWLRPGEPAAFDGLELSFPAVRRGGEILVHRNHGYPLVWVALVLVLAGAAWRIALPSVRIWVTFGLEGPRAHVREDAFADGAGKLLASWGGA